MKFDYQTFDQHMSELYQKYGFPGVAVTFRGPEGILYSKGFGVRCKEPEAPVDGDTVFIIASMSKSVTAFCLCLLEQEGKCSLDDPVSRYIPSFRIPGAPPQTVTLRHVCMDTSGLPRVQRRVLSISMDSIGRESEMSREVKAEAPNKMDRIEQIIDYIAQGDYRHEGYGIMGSPGEYMSYSNEGYAILSSVVDAVAGQPLEQFMMERVFRPLGMKRTILDLDGSQARKLAEGNITSLFERDDDGNLVWDDNFSVLPPFRGCACIYSTTNDMTLYYQMLAEKGRVNGIQVFPEAAVEELIGMRYPTTVKPFYCLGLRKRLIGSVPVCEHYGGLHGASTGGACIGDGYSISVFCNEGDVDVDPFMWVAYNLVAGLPWDTTHYRAVPNGETFADPEAITGRYVIMEGAPAYNVVYQQDGRLLADFEGTPVELRYCGGTLFAAYRTDEPDHFVNSMEFHIRDNKAWGVCCGERFHIRTDQEN